MADIKQDDLPMEISESPVEERQKTLTLLCRLSSILSESDNKFQECKEVDWELTSRALKEYRTFI